MNRAAALVIILLLRGNYVGAQAFGGQAEIVYSDTQRRLVYLAPNTARTFGALAAIADEACADVLPCTVGFWARKEQVPSQGIEWEGSNSTMIARLIKGAEGQWSEDPGHPLRVAERKGEGTQWRLMAASTRDAKVLLLPGAPFDDDTLREIGQELCDLATCEVRFFANAAEPEMVAGIISGGNLVYIDEPNPALPPYKVAAGPAVRAPQPENLQKLYVSLSGRARGEFETTAAFLERVAPSATGWHAFTISHGPSPKTPVQLGDEKGLEVNYSADVGEFEILLGLSDYLFLDDGQAFVGIDVTASKGKTSTYQGQTAMGAKTTVRKSSVTYFGVAVKGRPDVRTFRLPAAVETASTVKKNLSFLLVCHLSATSEGLTKRVDKHYSPGFSHPFDIDLQYNYLFAETVALWAVDKQTGEILGKFSIAGEGLPDFTAEP